MQKLLPWEALAKRMIWSQVGNLEGKRILDFGSGFGITASHYAKNNQVVAVEPDEKSVYSRCTDYEYQQLLGGIEKIRELEDESFDVILCHNVLEYAEKREEIVQEFYRILKPAGILSVVKHNRPGRVMQMAVLLNDFESANSLLDGNDGTAAKFGAIHYYEDLDLIKWCETFTISKQYGMRTFWDLQQKQEIQEDADWQEKMFQLEMRVSELEEYQRIAFFHHLILTK